MIEPARSSQHAARRRAFICTARSEADALPAPLEFRGREILRPLTMSCMPKLFIKVAVDESLKSQFTKLAKSRNQTEAKLLRSLVMAELDKESPSEKDESISIGDAVTQRINLRVAAFLLDAARVRAESKSMSVSRFISALLRTHLLRTPVMTDRELEVIAASNRELIAIGRNLNQVAHALNASLRRERDIPLHILNPEVINILRAEVLENRRAIRELKRVSLNAWEKSDGDH